MLTDAIRVNISLERAALAADGFGVPLILGPTQVLTERARAFASLAEMVDAGYATSDPEYTAARALLSQRRRPRRFYVGRRLAAVAHVQRVDVTTVADATLYRITIARPGRTPVNADFTSDAGATAGAIRDGLIAAVNGTAEPVTAAVADADSLSVTADVAGETFTLTTSDNLTQATTTPGVGAGEDLAAIMNAGAAWYATILTSRSAADILSAAAWTEAARPPKLLIAQTNDADAPAAPYAGGVSTDLLALLRSMNYRRTVPFWHDDNGERLDASVAGELLPLVPGSERWAMVEPQGVTPAMGVGSSAGLPLPSNQATNLVGPGPGPGGRNANIYYQVAPDIAWTWRGVTANGEWVDVVRGLDWLEAEIGFRVLNLQRANPKIPFTDEGIQAIAGAVRGALQLAEDRNVLATGWSIDELRAADISAANKAARVLSPPITWRATLAGAIHEVEIEGSVGA